MPTTPLASGAANASEYRPTPPSTSATSGITVVTASDSKATMAIREIAAAVVVR